MDDDFVSKLGRTDPWVAAITADRIEQALQNFPLPLVEGWDMARLALSIQDNVGIARGKAPQGNAEAIRQLIKAADIADKLHKAITSLGDTAELAAFWELERHRREEHGTEGTNYERDYRPTMLDSVAKVQNVLARAASQLSTHRQQGPRWTEREAAERRVGFALFLMPVFEEAYGKPARANNWKAEYGEEHEWPMFFRSIYMELFPHVEALNLAEVLQEAARQRPNFEALKRALSEQDATRDKMASE